MTRQFLRNIEEYRKWAFDISAIHDKTEVDRALGLIIDYSCWDVNEKGEEINEDGSVIPELTPENVELKDWVNELSFPAFAVYWIENMDDRMGAAMVIAVDFVCLKDFSKYEILS